MKIGFVLDDTLDTADGVQQYVLLLGSWLQTHGHEVHYLTTKSSRQDVDNLHSLGKQLRVKFNHNVVPFALPSSPRKIADVLEREQFDVLHIQMPYNPAFGARVISLAPSHTAIVGTFHIAPYSGAEKTLSKALGYWLKPSAGKLDAAMSVSKPAQQLAQESFGLQSVIVPNMVDVASYKLADSLQSHQPTEMIFVGRLVARKGCEHFIRSLALLDIPFHATIVGDGHERQKLEKLARHLNLAASITFEGFASESKKRKLLAGANIAVFPATGGESFGIVLIEAMAAGSCIVLAGDNPGYTSVMGSLTEALVSPSKHQTFAQKITSYATDKKAAQKLYDAQQELVKQYDVNTVAEQVLVIYDKAIAEHAKKSHTRK
jgi:phosphatidylinositol alpha-mannosyltransferase